jgi:hypothetical protein
VPAALGVNVTDVAVDVLFAPGVNITDPEPTAVPPLAQPLAPVRGPQTKKVTLPVGVPPVGFPVTVALSVLPAPSEIEADAGVVAVIVLPLLTAKHSVPLPSFDAA